LLLVFCWRLSQRLNPLSFLPQCATLNLLEFRVVFTYGFEYLRLERISERQVLEVCIGVRDERARLHVSFRANMNESASSREAPADFILIPGQRNEHGGVFFAETVSDPITLLFCSSLRTQSSVPAITGVYSTSMKSLHPLSTSCLMKASSVTSSKLVWSWLMMLPRRGPCFLVCQWI
jgi:hypothetical protein